jgi:hypothetical protein
MFKIQNPINKILNTSLLLASSILLASCNSSGTNTVEDTLDVNQQQQQSVIPELFIAIL